MKRIITLVAVLAVSLTTVFAQEGPKPKDDGWKERVLTEKIAFITAELQLTPEEAQVFWPVYNQYNKLGQECGNAVREAYKELGKALTDNEDIEAKLDAYTTALDEQTSHAAEASAAYKKVLPVEKVAKLYLAEEKFRFQQIERLHNGAQVPPQGGKRPGKGPQGPQGPKGHQGPQDGPQGGPQGPQHGQELDQE